MVRIESYLGGMPFVTQRIVVSKAYGASAGEALERQSGSDVTESGWIVGVSSAGGPGANGVVRVYNATSASAPDMILEVINPNISGGPQGATFLPVEQWRRFDADATASAWVVTGSAIASARLWYVLDD